MTQTQGSHDSETNKTDEKSGGINYLYIIIALLIFASAISLLHINSSKPTKARRTATATFNVHHDIVMSGEDSVATYDLPEGSVALFVTAGAHFEFVEMGHIKITADGKTRGRCNGKWDDPTTPDDIFQYANIWEIEAISSSKVSFTQKTKKQN